MEIIKSVNQLIAFLLELGLFFIVGFWGFQQGQTTITQYAFAVVLPLIAIVLWGIFAAPKSSNRLAFPVRLIFEMGLFTLASVLLYTTGNTTSAISFGLIALINEVTAYVSKQ